MESFLNNLGMLAAVYVGGVTLSMGIYSGWRWAAILYGPIETRTTITTNVTLPPVVVRHE